jgi:hypothetical protein
LPTRASSELSVGVTTATGCAAVFCDSPRAMLRTHSINHHRQQPPFPLPLSRLSPLYLAGRGGGGGGRSTAAARSTLHRCMPRLEGEVSRNQPSEHR